MNELYQNEREDKTMLFKSIEERNNFEKVIEPIVDSLIETFKSNSLTYDQAYLALTNAKEKLEKESLNCKI